MKPLLPILFWAAIAAVSVGPAADAADMRLQAVEERRQREALLESARQMEEEARQEAAEARQRIVADRKALQDALEGLREEKAALEAESRALEKELETLKEAERDLELRVADRQAEVGELSGLIRASAKDIDALLDMSPQSAFAPDRTEALQPVVDQSAFPGMEDVQRMADLLMEEVRLSGEVRLESGTVVDRNGVETTADILMVGNFTAAYRMPGETGFLLYSEPSRRLFALSKLPSASRASRIRAYMEGRSADVPVDISRGAALRQLTHRLSLLEQVPKGGPIVWPILGIGALALLIVAERVVYLLRKSLNAEAFVSRLCRHASKEEWSVCTELCEQKREKPIPRVLLAGLQCRRLDRQELENVLQEAILNEIPRMERFLSTLGMLAAIAPLLGLLGTVTGMINTFQAITYFGTGDPKTMSGGISEALVTTMLGLAVAIPILLAHTLLSRKVDNMIAQMEEKAVSFVNAVMQSGPVR